jgi:hypothetical protein
VTKTVKKEKDIKAEKDVKCEPSYPAPALTPFELCDSRGSSERSSDRHSESAGLAHIQRTRSVELNS